MLDRIEKQKLIDTAIVFLYGWTVFVIFIFISIAYDNIKLIV